jgi:hypothetical protein
MADLFLGQRAGEATFTVRVTGLDQLQKKLSTLGPAIRADCELAVANYLIGQLVNKEVPPEKRVTRRSVYGTPFASKKQRNWFFFALSHGLIDVPYRRRGKAGGIATQWHLRQTKNGIWLYNDDPGAVWVYGDTTQNLLIGRIGWRTIGTIVEDKKKNLDKVLDRAAKATIKKKGLA